jgi:uncharacterized protein (TIGR03435 family)
MVPNLRKLFLPALACLVFAAPTHAQVVTMYHPAGPLPSYDVASIKPAPPNSGGVTRAIPGGTVTVAGGPRNSTLIRNYILSAYGLSPVSKSQIVGGPAWLDTDAYVIEAKPSDDLRDAMQKMTPAEQANQNRMMQQSLLADRFKLKAHFETRVLPIYELAPTKGGLKIKPVAAPPPRVPGSSAPLPPPRFFGPGSSIPPGMTAMTMGRGNNTMIASATTMGSLINMLRGTSDVGGKPILDKTGFTANFDIPELKWANLDAPASADSSADDAAPSLFTALEETLGLKLTTTKGPVEVLVIDSIDRPSEN